MTPSNPEPQIVFSWSGGKDSLLALEAIDPPGEPLLLTTVNESNDRISMHGVRETLLRKQVENVGARLRVVNLPPDCSNEEYNERMSGTLERLVDKGYDTVAFGDVYLEDVREYRESRMETLSLESRFPIWNRPTEDLSKDFIARGYRAVIVCVNPDVLEDSYLGRTYDRAFLEDLPEEVDPCGENGEFHTFVHDGPLFGEPVGVERGAVVERNDFLYCDLLPGNQPNSNPDG